MGGSKLRKITPLIFAALASSNVLSQTTTWTNQSGNELWSDPANWTNGVPNANIAVTIPLSHNDANNQIDLEGATVSAKSIFKADPLVTDLGLRLFNGTLITQSVSGNYTLDGCTFDCTLQTMGASLTLLDQSTVNGPIVGGDLVASGIFVNLKGTSTYTGATAVSTNHSLTVSGSILNSNDIEIFGTLTTNAASQHLSAIASVHLFGGSWRNSRNNSTDQPNPIGQLDFADGIIGIYNDGLTISPARIARKPGAFVDFSPSAAPSFFPQKNLTASVLPPRFGDDATSQRRAIFPWGFANDAPFTTGPDLTFMCYDAGFRPLQDPAEFSTTLVDGTNVKLTASAALSGTSQPNSITLKGATLTLGTTGDLNIASGGIMLLPGNTIGGGIIAPTSSNAAITSPGEMIVYVCGANNALYNVTKSAYLIDAPLRANSISIVGDATLELHRANSFPGGALVLGTLVIMDDVAALGTSTLTLGGSEFAARLRLQAPNVTIPNAINLQRGGDLQVPPTGTTTWSGDVYGDGGLSLDGGNIRMTGSDNGVDPYGLGPGNISLTIAGAYTSQQATLSSRYSNLFGNGTFLGSVTILGGSVSPGESGTAGKLTLGAANLQGGALQEDIGGIVPGDGYDQLDAVDSLSFTNISPSLKNTLTASFSSGFIPTTGETFTIFDDQFAGPVLGIFDGLPEGAVFNADGTWMRISYVGGDGNDVVLTVVVPEPACICCVAVATPQLLSRRRRRSLRYQ